MDLKYLNTFRVIAEEGSFTRAAERDEQRKKSEPHKSGCPFQHSGGSNG